MGVSGTCNRIFMDYIIHALFMKAAWTADAFAQQRNMRGDVFLDAPVIRAS
jgi:hypothetical protein